MKGQTALMGWNLLGRNMGLRYQMLASELASLVGSGTQVMDQNTGKVRNATWGDVAILARTNEHVTQIAQKLHDASIPLNITMPGPCLKLRRLVWSWHACDESLTQQIP